MEGKFSAKEKKKFKFSTKEMKGNANIVQKIRNERHVSCKGKEMKRNERQIPGQR